MDLKQRLTDTLCHKNIDETVDQQRLQLSVNETAKDSILSMRYIRTAFQSSRLS